MRKNFLTIVLIVLFVAAYGQNPMQRMLLGPDVPATTYWTWNGSYIGTSGSLLAGNLTFTCTASNGGVLATKPGGTTAKSDDRYYEVYVDVLGNNMSIGISNSLSPNLNTWAGADSHGWTYYCNGTAGGKWEAGSLSFPGYTAFNTGNWVGIVLKSSTNQMLAYSKVGSTTTLEFTITIPAGSYYPFMSSNAGKATANFGASGWQLTGAPFGATGWDN